MSQSNLVTELDGDVNHWLASDCFYFMYEHWVLLALPLWIKIYKEWVVWRKMRSWLA